MSPFNTIYKILQVDAFGLDKSHHPYLHHPALQSLPVSPIDRASFFSFWAPSELHLLRSRALQLHWHLYVGRLIDVLSNLVWAHWDFEIFEQIFLWASIRYYLSSKPTKGIQVWSNLPLLSFAARRPTVPSWHPQETSPPQFHVVGFVSLWSGPFFVVSGSLGWWLCSSPPLFHQYSFRFLYVEQIRRLM